MPGVERHVWTNAAPAEPHLFDQVHLYDRDLRPWYVQLTEIVASILEHLPEVVMYLDSDTYFLDAVPEVFQLLVRSDFVAAHAPGRQTARTVGAVPPSFPEVNIGVILMRNNAAVRALWQDVHRRLLDSFDVYGNNDQAPLREALWNSKDLRLGILPPEYNCRFRFGTFVGGRVKVLHGRGDHEAVGANINAKTGMRVWRP